MYVCVCHGITDRQIHQAVDAGATSLRLVRKELPVGSNCGRCVGCAAQVIKDRLAQQQCVGAAPCAAGGVVLAGA
ncbi:MAG: bacterioferritin-associated ferredoxin [Steroidobacteraceae bacterium]